MCGGVRWASLRGLSLRGEDCALHAGGDSAWVEGAGEGGKGEGEEDDTYSLVVVLAL